MTTIRDVAKAAGVSPITVSRVVNRQENVNPETRARVEKAIDELGYVRNLAARSLRSRETYTIGLIMPDITNSFWTTVARGVEDAAQGDGYSVLLCNSDENPEKFTKYLDTLLQQRVDGVLVVPVTNDSLHFSLLGEKQVPTVVLDRRVAGWTGDSVYCDSIAAAHGLTQHLLALGHTSIAIFSGPATTSTAEDRVAGYCLALYKAGLPVDPRLIFRGEFRASSGRAMTREMLASGLSPSAIIATNNAIAAGILEELKNHGKNVPADVAVVCFDEIPEMERFFPFLTSAVQPAYDMGINATQLLLSRINAGQVLRPRQVVLPTRLILRYSCGRFLKSGGAEAEASFTLLPDLSSNLLIKPLEETDRELLPVCAPGYQELSQAPETDPALARPDRERLRQALAFEKTDRLPCLDGRGAGRRVLEHVLGRGLRYAADGINLHPQDLVEFAQKTGLDAVPCEISWQLGAVSCAPSENLLLKTRQVFPPPALASQISALENLLAAAEGSGVGVYARFSSFFGNALAALRGSEFDDAQESNDALEKLMDMLARHQERVMRAICDRFGRDLCFVSVQDDALLSPEHVGAPGQFQGILLPRLRRMLTPAREHGLPVALDTVDLREDCLADLAECGVSFIQTSRSDPRELERLARAWQGRLVFSAGLPAAAGLQEQIRAASLIFARQGGLIFSLDERALTTENFSPQDFVGIMQSIQRQRRSQ